MCIRDRYTYNPCSAKERAREFALEAMAEDLQRMEALPGNYYNFHPGAHVGQEMCIRDSVLYVRSS